MSPSERERLLSAEVPSARFCGPDLQFEHCQSLDELNGRQSTFSPQALHPPTRTEVESRYSVSQQLKDIMETIIPTDNSNMLMERHRREVTRCWSRERVVRNEVILSIRCPNDSGLDYAYSRSNIYSGTSALYKSATCINTNSDSWFDQLGQSTRSVSTRSLCPTIALIGRPVPVYVNGKSESNATSDKGTVAFTCLEQPYKQDNQLLLASSRLTQSLEGKEELSG
ncbi:unnamed protein product [Dicrocoelium dendriticum]|nr:unnamed protein product [Dicrocoelium dendriticum]